MLRQTVLVYLVITNGVECGLDFPPGFKFGAATSSYQIEGAWNINGRTPSLWDEFVHANPDRIEDSSTGDVACDSYHLWRRDVEMASELGLDFYRFSLSWTRLFPNGFTNYVNEDGRRYYSDLIDALLEADIEPVVTLHHWDLPQKFQDLGGWTNPLITEWFEDYARAVYTLYADRVTTWLTINEPVVLCDMTYHAALYAPGILSPGIGNYICSKNVLIAHAKAWRIYDNEFKNKYKGRVSIVNNHMWFESAPGLNGAEAEMARQLFGGIYTYPIYSEKGGWPPIIEEVLANKSAQEGYQTSRLPALTQEEIEFIKGTYDFYGLNFYTARLVRKPKQGEEIGPWPFEGSKDLDLVVYPDPTWKQSTAKWFYIYPEALRLQLKWFKDQFGDVEVIIIENGYANMGPDLDDQDRVQYYKEHLHQVLLSIHEDGVRLTGFTAWSLMDNFEWFSGYLQHFGLYAVDFSSPQRTRTPRASAHYYAELIRHRSLHFHFTYTSGERRMYSHTNLIILMFFVYILSISL